MTDLRALAEIRRWEAALDAMPDDQVSALWGWFYRYWLTRIGAYVKGRHVAARGARWGDLR
jgi:hypothetical protein